MVLEEARLAPWPNIPLSPNAPVLANRSLGRRIRPSDASGGDETPLDGELQRGRSVLPGLDCAVLHCQTDFIMPAGAPFAV